MSGVLALCALEIERRALALPDGGAISCGPSSRGVGVAALREMALRRRAVGILGLGFAAALDPRLREGDVVVAEGVVGEDGRALPCDSAWRERLAAALGDARVGVFASTSSPLLRACEKSALRRRSRAAAADMESLLWARVAVDLGVPFASARTISDRACVDVPSAFALALDERGGLRVGRLLSLTALSPRDWVSAATTAIRGARALRALARVGARLAEVASP